MKYLNCLCCLINVAEEDIRFVFIKLQTIVPIPKSECRGELCSAYSLKFLLQISTRQSTRCKLNCHLHTFLQCATHNGLTSRQINEASSLLLYTVAVLHILLMGNGVSRKRPRCPRHRFCNLFCTP